MKSNHATGEWTVYTASPRLTDMNCQRGRNDSIQQQPSRIQEPTQQEETTLSGSGSTSLTRRLSKDRPCGINI